MEELQADPDDFMALCNAEKTNQGKYCQGRTPLQTFTDGMEVYRNRIFDYGVEGKEAAW